MGPGRASLRAKMCSFCAAAVCSKPAICYYISGMSSFPISWLVSILTLIAAYTLAWNTRIPLHARLLLCAFLLCLGTVALLLGLRLSFQLDWPGRVQPFLAIIAAPLAYLGFKALGYEAGPQWRKACYWDIVIVGLAFLGLIAPVPVSADVFILAINCIYLARIATLLRRNADDVPLVPPHAMHILRAAIYATLALIGLMVLADGLIVSASLAATDPQLIDMLTGVSGLFAGFIFVVALIAGPMIIGTPQAATAERQTATKSDLELMSALNDLMDEKQLYRDSNLTLSRVAKRLSVPARDVSAATNRTTGENFSRYINGHRIRYAQRALQDTNLPITEVMFEAGFLSKSSFNTEFRRITGQTPSAFRTGGRDL